jgi:signal recognition particle GTPase
VNSKTIEVTWLVITKLDGSGKRAITIAIQQESGISLRFVWTGKKLRGPCVFDRERFVELLL